MKGTIVALVLAASTVAFASSKSAGDLNSDLPFRLQGYSSSTSAAKVDVKGSRVSSTDGGKFAPRFDGLRFIETLITAHR